MTFSIYILVAAILYIIMIKAVPLGAFSTRFASHEEQKKEKGFLVFMFALLWPLSVPVMLMVTALLALMFGLAWTAKRLGDVFMR